MGSVCELLSHESYVPHNSVFTFLLNTVGFSLSSGCHVSVREFHLMIFGAYLITEYCEIS